MAELEKTVKGLQAGTAADSKQVSHIVPPQEADSGLFGRFWLFSLGLEFSPKLFPLTY